ncbi:MAG: DUF1223 domain-containing protein [Candidatus Acidiferrales bacterium]
MTKLFSRLTRSILVLFFLCCSARSAAAQMDTATSQRTPVIVELFTSEGCSSCPPADLLLQKLEAEQPLTGVDVIGLEEHVDYWNHDGWIDAYSSPEWTQRQLDYGARLTSEPYTPQMVVDGENQFVGSDARDASLAIRKAASSPKTGVEISANPPDAKGVQSFAVAIKKLAGDTPGDVAEVWLAVTEDGLRSSVNRGENAGHVLAHVATLRSLHKIGVAEGNQATVFTGDARVKFDSHWNRENLTVVVFVQERRSRKIIGAASVRIVPRSGSPAVVALGAAAAN